MWTPEEDSSPPAPPIRPVAVKRSIFLESQECLSASDDTHSLKSRPASRPQSEKLKNFSSNPENKKKS
jgi:hypothetical protein